MHKIFVKTKCVVSFNVPFVSRPKKGYIVSSQKSTCRIFKAEIYYDGLQRKRHKSVTTTPPTVREY